LNSINFYTDLSDEIALEKVKEVRISKNKKREKKEKNDSRKRPQFPD